MSLLNMSNSTVQDDDLVEVIDAEFDSYVLNPWTWLDPDGGTPSYVFILPIVAFFSLIFNIIIITVFVKEKLMTSANIIMIGIAISDTLTVLSPTPLLIYLYSCGINHVVPFSLCVSWEYLMKNVCSVTHTASIWLTMYLGINRYLAVCHPFVMRRRCTTKTAVETIFFIYALSVLFHLCRFIDTKYVPQYTQNNSTMVTCLAKHVDWLKEYVKIYECVYHWCHIICISIIPCTTLVVLDTIMLRHIRQSEIRRSAYIPKKHQIVGKNRQESIRTTKTIVIILMIVCLLELSVGTLLILWTLCMMNIISVPETNLSVASNIVHFCIYTSYPFIFLLYCRLSTKFRHGMRHFFRLDNLSEKNTIQVSLVTMTSRNKTI